MYGEVFYAFLGYAKYDLGENTSRLVKVKWRCERVQKVSSIVIR